MNDAPSEFETRRSRGGWRYAQGRARGRRTGGRRGARARGAGAGQAGTPQAPRGRGDRGRGPGRPDRGTDASPARVARWWCWRRASGWAGGCSTTGWRAARSPSSEASTWAPPRIGCWHWRARWAWAPSRPTTTGSNVQFLDGRRGLYPSVPGLPGRARRERRHPEGARPWTPWRPRCRWRPRGRAPRAAEWDSQTFETWKQANLTSATGKAVLDTATQAIWGAEPRDLSLLFVLFYIAAAGNERNPGSIVRLISVAGGAQESRFTGGSQLIAQRMARRLGKRVVRDSPVRRIRQRGGRWWWSRTGSPWRRGA